MEGTPSLLALIFALCCCALVGAWCLSSHRLTSRGELCRCPCLVGQSAAACVKGGCGQNSAGRTKCTRGGVARRGLARCWPRLGQRIAVIAPHAGSGKTFVAQRLAEALQLQYVSADALLWRKGDREGDPPIFLSRAERLPAFQKALGGPGGWVVDGQFADPKRAVGERRWHREIPDRCDTLVFLDLPRSTIFVQLLSRTIQRAWNGQPLHGGLWREGWRDVFCPGAESLLRHFVTSGGGAADRVLYQRIMADVSWTQVKVHLRSRREVDAFLRSLEATTAPRVQDCCPRAAAR